MGTDNYWQRVEPITQHRRFSRRGLLIGGGQGAVALAAMALIGCGTKEKAAPAGGPSSGPSSGAAASNTPRKGGTALTYYQYDPPTLDVQTNAPSQATWFGASIYSGILRFTWEKPWTVASDLAEKWETPSNLQYTFQIRKGVKWSDGTPFSAQDVLFNLKHSMGEKRAPLTPRFAGAFAKSVDSVTTPDDSTVIIKLKQPYGPLTSVLANNHAKLYKPAILEKNKQEEEFIGTGPYKLKQYLKNQVIEYERNPNYFLSGLPYLDGLKRLNIPEMSTSISALSTGSVHVNTLWPGLLPAQVELIKKAVGDKASITELPQNTLERFYVNVTKKPFNDKRVRKALNLALDRQEIVSRGLEGAGTIGMLDPRVSGEFAMPQKDVLALPGFRTPKDADIAEAVKLLAAAGYPSGVEFDLPVRKTARYVEQAQVAASGLTRMGLRAKLNQVEAAAGIVMQNKGEYGMTIVGGGSTFNDPFMGLKSQYVAQGAAAQWVGLKDPKIDEAVEKGFMLTDQNERKALALEIQKYLATEDTSSFGLAWDSTAIVQWKKLRGYYPGQDINQGMDFTEAWLSE